MNFNDLWLSKCTECSWEHWSFVSHRANNWADAHTGETGHKTVVTEED